MRSAIVVLSLFIATPVFSDEKGQSSPDWVDQFVDAHLCNTTLDHSNNIPEKYLKHVLNAYRVYLDQTKLHVATKLKEHHSHLQIRETIPFRGQEFPVLAVLGIGTSGVFYAVQTSDGVRTAEEFFATEVAERVGDFVSRADIHVYERDGNFVIEEFILGLPEYRVANTDALRMLGIASLMQAREISQWMMARVTDTETHDRDDVLIEIPSGRVVALYPYAAGANHEGPPLIHSPHDPVAPVAHRLPPEEQAKNREE
jgi:hypothetical protein